MELLAFLTWVVKFGAGLFAYFIVDNVPALVRLQAIPKRIAACGIAAGIAILGWLAQIAMLYEPAPVGARPWIEMIFLIATSAFGLATLIHTKDLPDEAPAPLLRL